MTIRRWYLFKLIIIGTFLLAPKTGLAFELSASNRANTAIELYCTTQKPGHAPHHLSLLIPAHEERNVEIPGGALGRADSRKGHLLCSIHLPGMRDIIDFETAPNPKDGDAAYVPPKRRWRFNIPGRHLTLDIWPDESLSKRQAVY